LLCAFIATTQQDDKLVTALFKIDTISWAMMNTQFTDALANRFYIASQSIGQPENTGGNLARESLSLRSHRR